MIAAANFAAFFAMMLAGAADLILQKLLIPTNRFAVVSLLSLLVALWLQRALRKEGAQA